VYFNHDASAILGNIDPSKPLLDQMKGAFSRQVIPNWQDSSTTLECREIEAAAGGAEQLALITGSKAHERFTGPQIMRWKKAHPDQWKNTSRIGLVSSYLTTLLCLDGEIKGIDESDVCGMNLWTMNTPKRGWNKEILGVIAGDEADKLGSMLGEVERDGGRPVGKIGRWFIERFGFTDQCMVYSGTGDNPATFLSLTRKSQSLCPFRV
jgi:xylulokinase